MRTTVRSRILLGTCLLASLIPRASAADSADRILLQPRQGHMACSARVPTLDGQVFSLGIPETIGCRERMILNFPEVDIRWTGPDKDGAISSEWITEGRIRYKTTIVPATDYVDVEMTIENLSDRLWRDVFAFNCVNPVRAPAFKDWELDRTYMSQHGKPTVMSSTKRVKGHMPTVGFYLHERTPWGQESPFVRGFHATSPNRTDGSWIVTLSDPPGSYMAATSPNAEFLFDNLDRCCIHSAAGFGDIPPRGLSTTVCRLYFAHGSLDDFLTRYRNDTNQLTTRQKWAEVPRPRIALEGLAPPRDGQKGRLGSHIRADGMEGALEMRFPETLRSSLGLHFIDHYRRDMPQLSPFPEQPTWERNDETGEIRYTCRTSEGVEFVGRARPYEEEIYLEFSVTNNTTDAIHGVSPQMCLSMAPSADFNQQGDLPGTFAWFDSRWANLSTTTPTPAEKGREPWLQILTQSAGEYRGPRDNPDGWWFVDQKADFGIIARQSRDQRHLLAIAWQDAKALSTNTRIPCLHAGPGRPASLKPGEQAFWRGKIYLMSNDPESLLVRFNGDRGVWPYPEVARKPRRK